MSVRCVLCLCMALAITGAAVAAPSDLPAQALVEEGQAAGTATGTASVKGTVADSTGAVIPGATVTLTSASGKAAIVQSQSDGSYTFTGRPRRAPIR